MPQELVIKTAAAPVGKTGLLVIFAAEGATLSGSAEQVWARTGLDMARLAAATKFAGKPGQLLDIPAPANLDADMLYVVGGPGSGDKKPASPTAGTDRGGALMARILASRANEVALLLDGPDDTAETIADLAAGLKLRHYKFDRYKTKKNKDDENGEPSDLAVTLYVADPAAVDAALEQRLATVEGTLLARDLINEPPNVLGPVEFAEHCGRSCQAWPRDRDADARGNEGARHGRAVWRSPRARRVRPGWSSCNGRAAGTTMRRLPLSARAWSSIPAAFPSSLPAPWKT